jgi:hypothetical protein
MRQKKQPAGLEPDSGGSLFRQKPESSNLDVYVLEVTDNQESSEISVLPGEAE